MHKVYDVGVEGVLRGFRTNRDWPLQRKAQTRGTRRDGHLLGTVDPGV